MLLKNCVTSNIVFLVYLLIGGVLLKADTISAKQPNVIIFMTDDQGYGDMGAHGHPVVRTPNMDRLHAESVRFTDFHVDPSCAPTRSALMTGKYAHRAGVWHTIAGGAYLRSAEVTMADIFRANGYRTGIFGKWHLGTNFPYRPIDRGFSEWLGQGGGGTGTTPDWFDNDRVNDHYLHNDEWVQIDGYGPDVFFGAAIDFMLKEREQPFFVYLPTLLPHSPHTIPDPAWADYYLNHVSPSLAYYFATIEHLDRNLGRLYEVLDEEGLLDDTILIFLSDNGAAADTAAFFNAGMRGHKGQVYEGGHRVPFFIRWVNGELQHGYEVADLTAHFDLLPTLVELCALELVDEIDFDGRSFAGQLRDPSLQLPERTLFVDRQRSFHPRKSEQTVVAMTSRWRLLVNQDELYDIRNDPGQQLNVLHEHPDVVQKLRADFDHYWDHVTLAGRERAQLVVGDERAPETFLHAGDWHISTDTRNRSGVNVEVPASALQIPWNHWRVAVGLGAETGGSWLIRPVEPGLYRFEVRRWPREAQAPIAGVPQFDKEVDSWGADGPRTQLIYPIDAGATDLEFLALPVAKVQLRVGESVVVKPVSEDSQYIIFEMELAADSVEVEGLFLDSEDKVLAGAFYIYCSKVQ
jgi:arylsulfatase A-like enzyme